MWGDSDKMRVVRARKDLNGVLMSRWRILAEHDTNTGIQSHVSTRTPALYTELGECFCLNILPDSLNFTVNFHREGCHLTSHFSIVVQVRGLKENAKSSTELSWF